MMNESERTVYCLLRDWRRLHAEKGYFATRDNLSQMQKEERLEQISRILKMLEAWMGLLTADERYVVKRHLVDGIDWSRVVYEYNTKLLRPVKKSRSSLRRMQTTAIAKAARFAEQQGFPWEKSDVGKFTSSYPK